jgi:hypothetical protein
MPTYIDATNHNIAGAENHLRMPAYIDATNHKWIQYEH